MASLYDEEEFVIQKDNRNRKEDGGDKKRRNLREVLERSRKQEQRRAREEERSSEEEKVQIETEAKKYGNGKAKKAMKPQEVYDPNLDVEKKVKKEEKQMRRM